MKIKEIKAIEILDSRGNPTVKTTVFLADGTSASAFVPSGASTGKHEAWELRDGGKRYNGLGVSKAVLNVNTKINQALKGKSVSDQKKIDQILISLDGTKNKKRLGANAILSVSLACARASAKSSNLPLYQRISQIYGKNSFDTLPTPMFNILNGGAHANNGVDIQEFMIVPKGVKGFSNQLQSGVEIYQALKRMFSEKNLATTVGDEGGFAPKLQTNSQGLTLLTVAVKTAGYKIGGEIFLAIDAAASEFYKSEKGGCYFLTLDNLCLKSNQLISLYQEWVEKYALISIEDGLSEDDWETWKSLNQELGEKIMVIGDDLFVTNPKRIQKGIKMGVANAVLIKSNQIGTLTETLEAISLAQKAGFKTIISHRSGETCDNFIADLAVGVGADYIKTGAPCRGERVAKYNRLLEIEEELKRS